MPWSCRPPAPGRRIAMRLNLFTFCPDGGPMFEVWGAGEVDQQLLCAGEPRRAGCRGSRGVCAEPGGRPQPRQRRHDLGSPGRTIGGRRGEASRGRGAGGADARGDRRRGAHHRLHPCRAAGQRPALSDDRVPARALARPDGELQGSTRRDVPTDERDLIYLTGTCTLDQMATWDPAFVDAASSVWFG